MRYLLLLSFITLFSFFNTQAQEVYWPTYVAEINTGTNATYLIQSANLDGASINYGYILGAFFTNDSGVLQCGGFTNCGSATVQIAVMADDITTEVKDGFYEGEEITWLAFSTFAEQTYTATVVFSQLPPFGSNTFTINGLNIVTDFNISSAVLGCMVDEACNYNANATEEDNSCTYAEENYNCDGSCIDTDGDLVCDIYEITGCTDPTACNYYESATEEDNTCTYPEPDLECGEITLMACMDATACNFNELATVEGVCIYTNAICQTCSGEVDGTGVILFNDSDLDGVCDDDEIYGCTDSLFIEFSDLATEEDDSCSELVVLGCTNSEAFNYNSNANVINETCLYDVVVDFSTTATNTITNFSVTIDTIELTLGTQDITEGDVIGGFHIIDGQLYCVGFTSWTGNDFSINLWMDDPATEEIDGLTNSSTIYWIVQQEATMFNYLVDLTLIEYPYVTFVTQITLNLTTIIGCLDDVACNYNVEATNLDASCVYAADNYDCDNVCLIDSDNDGICNENEISGCISSWADNFNALATEDDESCYKMGCTLDWADNYDPFATLNPPTEEFVENTGSNMTVVFSSTFLSSLNVTHENAYIVALTTDYLSVGSIGIYGITQTHFMTLWGDDTSVLSVEINGAVEGEILSFLLVDGGSLYDISMPTAVAYTTNTMSWQLSVAGLTLTDDTNYNCTRLGCTSDLADNYDELATDDDESCFIYGCTIDIFPNYNSIATLDDLSCDMNSLDVYGCTDEFSSGYNPDANNDNGTCYLGCMSDWADNYEALATANDSSCTKLGCTSVWSDNYDDLATEDDESCYKEGCTQDWADNYDEFATDDDGSCSKLGCTSVWSDNYDDLATEDDESCTKLGCTSDWSDNYDVLATDDDGSCYKKGCIQDWADNFDPFATISPIETLPEPFVGNTGSNMTVMLTPALVSSLTITESNAYIVAFNSVGLVIGSKDLYGLSQMSLAIWGDDNITTETDGALAGELISFQLVNGTDLYDLVMPSPVSYTANGLAIQTATGVLTLVSGDPNSGCIRLGCISYWADNYDVLATEDDESCSKLGCTDVSDCNYDTFATIDDESCIGDPGCLDHFYVEYNPLAGCSLENACQISWIQLYDSLQVEYNDLDISFNIEEQELNNTILSLDSLQFEYVILNETYIDSITQITIDYNSLNTECTEDMIQSNLTLDSLNYLNGSLSEEIEYWSSPIVIDLILGWNIIGYTSKEPQDIVAALQVIDDIILIVKNNAAEVYWPEFGFNGIGNLIPGQGYQMKVSDAYSGFTYPNVNGERIDLNPTVPQWAIDMQVDMHPNDIRTLVKVVNMLGQEVNPATQFNGEVLLYLYNDATVEKKIVE
jgi:hypothetical protein